MTLPFALALIACIAVLFTIPALIAFWQHRSDPADEIDRQIAEGNGLHPPFRNRCVPGCTCLGNGSEHVGRSN